MLYEGKRMICQKLEGDIAELKFDAQGESVNKFDYETLQELDAAIQAVGSDASIKGLMLSSGKEAFLVGADITEFLGVFKQEDAQILEWLSEANRIFSSIEDLDMPTVTAINGYALGGGLEVALTTSFRVMTSKSKIGLPEVKLGIFPGFGGTVRLSRLVGADNAIEWIAMGSENKAAVSLKNGVVDAVVAPEKLREASLNLLKRAIAGELDWKKPQAQKKGKLRLNEIESLMVFEGAKAFIAGKAGEHYPAPVEAVKVMQKGATLERDQALEIERKGFLKVAKTSVAKNLISIFLGDQYLKKESKTAQGTAQPVKHAAVLGAGIMGGGIAYQSAYKGVPIHMKDINEDALQLGLSEASKLLSKLVKREKIDNARMAEVLSNIRATLSYDELKEVDIVVEAVVENPNIKQQVLSELEGVVRENAILTSNTSTISISSLAEGLKRPENFCGMHFFNPVHRMPLVEVIRGEKSSDVAVATTVAYAAAMGKTPIVVNDCPGFLVNRILMPYFGGFMGLLSDGADFERVDKVMTKFGWPMGPGYLLDVVGIDTAHHASSVMAEGFPDRMKYEHQTALDIMFEKGRYGQKNNIGFYIHSVDKKGKPKKQADPAVAGLLEPIVREKKDFTDQEIILRMMIPMIIESARCLEDKIVQTPTEVDMGLIFGIGFPPFRGGALRHADEVGLSKFCELADQYAHLGKLYEPTASMRELAASGKGFYTE